MKKLFALVLALMLALSCVAASANTVYTKLTLDGDVIKQLLPGFGVPEDQLAMVDPIQAVVNALGVNVVTAADGAQVDLDLNGAQAISVGVAMDDAGTNIVSTLFPNYYLTLSNETVSSMMEQLAANMPTGGGEGGMDMAALTEIFGGYFQKWMEACAAAGQPGEPVPGEYEFEGYTFDTMVPVTVDVAAIADATRSLMDELLADPAAMAAIKGMAQGAAQNSGEEFDEANFEAEFKAGFEEWLAHFPETAEAAYYCNGEEGVPFYMEGSAVREENTYAYTMLFVDEGNMDMAFTMTGEQDMEAGFAMEDGAMSLYLDMGGMYFGLSFAAEGDQLAIDVYFMNTEKPLASIAITVTEGGERTLPVDAAGKTALAVEEIMADGNSEAAQGLYADVQANGLGALLGVAMQQVPELGSLMGMAG